MHKKKILKKHIGSFHLNIIQTKTLITKKKLKKYSKKCRLRIRFYQIKRKDLITIISEEIMSLMVVLLVVVEDMADSIFQVALATEVISDTLI